MTAERDSELTAADLDHDGVASLVKDVLSLEQIARFKRHGSEGEEHHGRCLLCGAISWLFTRTDKAADVVVHPMTSSRCDRCAEFSCRFPDVFAFVQSVAFSAKRNQALTSYRP